MILGNLAALTQDNVKRMLAYSSIAHAGYILLGVISLNALGLRGILVYSIVYVFANLGIWATVLMLRRHQYAGERVDDFEGLSRRAPLWAFAMVIFLLSLGGIPPTAGFIGKYFLFAAAVQAGFGWLAIIAVLMSAVSMFYYLRLVVAMYLREGVEAEFAITHAAEDRGRRLPHRHAGPRHPSRADDRSGHRLVEPCRRARGAHAPCRTITTATRTRSSARTKRCSRRRRSA